MAITSSSITSIIGNGVQNLQAQMQAQQAQNQMQLGQMQANVVETPYPEDPDLWSDDERLKMVVWFMKMHHEEDIKGFKAMRDIERSVERAEQEEQHRRYWEIQAKAMQAMSAAQMAQNNSLRNIVDDLPLSKEPKKESWWKKLLK